MNEYLTAMIPDAAEAFETEACRGFPHVRLTEAYMRSVEEAEQKSLAGRESDDGAGIPE